MVDTTVFVLHYSDDKIHPQIKVSNLALNELLLRCIQSIERNTSYPHKLVVVDNGSPEVGHEDAVNLLKEHRLTPEFLWVREDWHPVAVGANRAMDALETDYMAFTTSDKKPSKNWLRCMIEPLKNDPWHMTACESNKTLYGIGDPNQYRTPELWDYGRVHKSGYSGYAEAVKKYFANNGVPCEIDEYNEPVPVSRAFIKEGNARISTFTASKDFIDKVGRYDERYLRACEYQYYIQALKRGIEKPTSEAPYVYDPHFGGLYRKGVGAYHQEGFKHNPEGDFRFTEGKGNVFNKER